MSADVTVARAMAGMVLVSVAFVGMPFAGALFLWKFTRLFRFAQTSYTRALQTLLISGCGALAAGTVVFAPAVGRAQDFVHAAEAASAMSVGVGVVVAIVASAKILGGTMWKATGAVGLSLVCGAILSLALLWILPAVDAGELPDSPVEFVQTLWGLAFGGPIRYQVTVLHVVPLGSVPPSDVDAVRDILEQTFPPLTVSVLDRADLPSAAYNAGRGQYDASVLCERMAALSNHNAIRTIGITDSDLFVPGDNFVFSCTKPRGLGAVMSVLRLRDPGSGDLTRLRYRKIAVRAIGLMWGFRPDQDRRCIMAYSNSLAELDEKGTAWCGREAEDVRRIEGLR